MREGFPVARAGWRVGLFGGSFDPAHEGHAHVTREALRRFALDEVWWLVSPGNPLKERGPASLDRRIARAREVMRHPRVKVLDIEARLGTRYTFATLREIDALYPGVRFVWLMGADNLSDFHRWERWGSIMARMPVGVLARPGQRISARMSRVARIHDTDRIPATRSRLLPLMEPPAWCFVNVPMSDASSTRIRASGGWPAA